MCKLNISFSRLITGIMIMCLYKYSQFQCIVNRYTACILKFVFNDIYFFSKSGLFKAEKLQPALSANNKRGSLFL